MYSESLGLKIRDGYEEMNRSSIFIYGLARDISRELTALLPKIETLCSKFRYSSIFIYENDSQDETPAILCNWAKEQPLRRLVLSEKLNTERMTDTSTKRIELMSEYRNRCLDKLDSIGRDYDYIMPIDLDLSGFSIDGIASSFGSFFANKNIGGIGSNGRINITAFSRHYDIYYDAFAHKCNRTLGRGFSTIQSAYRKFNIGDDLIEVDSCFNGLMIYRSDAIRNLRYRAIPKYAEHVPFNNDIKYINGYEIYLNPNQLTYYDDRTREKYEKVIG